MDAQGRADPADGRCGTVTMAQDVAISQTEGCYAVSANGKTMHATEVGTDETGAKYKWTEVWERQ
jgi:hypothetical protein